VVAATTRRPTVNAFPVMSVIALSDSRDNSVRDEINDIGSLSPGGSVAEWLACWTQAQKGPGSNRSRDAVG